MKHSFSIDVEEWFDGMTQGRDNGFERRLESQVNDLLNLLEEYSTHATFFWLGSRAKEYPWLVSRVASLGHEIGCHGFNHVPVYNLTPMQFRTETTAATAMLEDMTGKKVAGFRAPYFSITRKSLWALEVLAECGYSYDSSIYPIRHWRYGIPNHPSSIHTISTPSGNIVEVPMVVRRIVGVNIPCSGGAYFRIYPYALTASNILVMDSLGKSVGFNIHPWEIDPGHPRIKRSFRERIPHYYSLKRTEIKLHRLLSDFSFTTIANVLSTA
jgi:polysaccharide deacetylase family protein (PEP-CTERM system associated)